MIILLLLNGFSKRNIDVTSMCLNLFWHQLHQAYFNSINFPDVYINIAYLLNIYLV